MKSKRRLYLAAAFALIAIACIQFLLMPTPSRLAHDKTPARDHQVQESGRTISPPATDARNQFAATDRQMASGWPVPVKDFPRGENQRRQYAVPAAREIHAPAGTQAPAVLSMLPADGRTKLLPEETDLHTKLARRLVFDPTALDRILQGETARLLAPTPDGQWLEVEFQQVKSRAESTHTLIGKIVGTGQTSDAQFVYHDGILHGTIANYNTSQEFEYRILADGHMMVRELDQSSMTAGCGIPNDCGHADCDHSNHASGEELLQQELDEQGIDLQIQPSSDSTVAGDTAGWRKVDVVVGYDQGARVADGGVSQIEARIIASVDRMSMAFVNSLVTNTEVMLLGTIEDPNYVFPGSTSGNMGEELGNLNNPTDGVLDTVSNYATLLGADLQAFILKQADGSAGVAYLPGRSSITARDYMTATRLTFAHELGHNLGCDHSWGDSSQSVTHNRYGWRLDGDGNSSTTGDRVRTIMAYDWGWGTGVRIPYFSNPAVTYAGARTGQVNGYNVIGDNQSDARYAVNGLSYNNSVAGFDGTNPSLGANNANVLLNGSPSNSNYGTLFASNRATRAALAVTSPSAGGQWTTGSSLPIFFRGGDHEYTVTVQIYKGAALAATIANNVSNAATKRNFTWSIPSGQTGGSDYFVRVTLTHPANGSAYADSGMFTVLSSAPSAPTGLVATAGNAQVDLAWNASSNATSYNVKRATVSGGPYATIRSQAGTSFTDTAVINGTTYYYVVTASNAAGESAASAQASAMPEAPSGPLAHLASGETTTFGTVSSGSYTNTWSSDNIYQVLTESQSGGSPKTRRSQLEHVWTLNVTGGELVTFFVEAHHTANTEGDNFLFSYSTDGTNYTDMVTVTKTSDDNVPLSYDLPGDLSGVVYVRVVDTDRTAGRSSLDSLYVDQLMIVCESASNPPGVATNPSPADGATGISVNRTLEWTPDALASSHDVYFGTSLDFQGNQTTTTFDPGTLSPLTTYYWRVDEVNSVGTTTGPVWSFTTAAAAPEMYVSAITLGVSKSGRNYQGVATVKIVEAGTGLPVSGATVTGNFTGSFSETASAVTDSAGNARVLTSTKKPLPLSFTFTVTNVADGIRNYRSSLNTVTSASGSF